MIPVFFVPNKFILVENSKGFDELTIMLKGETFKLYLDNPNGYRVIDYGFLCISNHYSFINLEEEERYFNTLRDSRELFSLEQFEKLLNRLDACGVHHNLRVVDVSKDIIKVTTNKPGLFIGNKGVHIKELKERLRKLGIIKNIKVV